MKHKHSHALRQNDGRFSFALGSHILHVVQNFHFFVFIFVLLFYMGRQCALVDGRRYIHLQTVRSRGRDVVTIYFGLSRTPACCNFILAPELEFDVTRSYSSTTTILHGCSNKRRLARTSVSGAQLGIHVAKEVDAVVSRLARLKFPVELQ